MRAIGRATLVLQLVVNIFIVTNTDLTITLFIVRSNLPRPLFPPVAAHSVATG